MRFASLIAAAAIALPLASAHAAPTRIDDPLKFVKAMYTTVVSKKPEPTDIYTPRLDALFKLDQKEAGGEVGRIDFDFWMNGQDGDVTDLTVTQTPVENTASRVVVVAKFKSFKTPEEIHLYFEKTPAGWKLDDARSATGEQWTLSTVLKYGD
jgi:hypothetical protein